MPDRKSLILTLCLASSLALLASVLDAPIRTLGLGTASSRPENVRRGFDLLPNQPSTFFLSAAIASETTPQVNALPSENEEQDRAEASDEPRISFLIPCSFRKIPDRQLISPSSILSHYPLRC